jgi:hypothetical protein
MSFTIDNVVKTHLALRQRKREVEARLKAEVTEISSRMDKLEAWIRQQAEAQGVSSFKTPSGTAFLSTVDAATVADWDATLAFIRENEAFDMLERRVSKTAVRAYIDATGYVPPGVNFTQRVEVSVRKPSAKADD